MRPNLTTALISLALMWPMPKLSWGQDSAAATRKLLEKTNPVYPDLARKLQLSGTVKMGVTIAPNGTVKKAKVLGGSPLLAQAAQEAVQKWKWAAASDETTEVIEINFHPR